ncbi:MAG: tRNA dihydrouridine synthase DusB [Clostridiaceae bacterium]|nr:tRNA dihydrouridine synthase DusB [Clostridiaceae bacterium]
MEIGGVPIPGRVALAPMAGVTDHAYRMICRRCGATFTVTEMVSAKGLLFDDRKTRELLWCGGESPVSAQIFGSDPDDIRRAAPKAIEVSGAELLDLNMGCPMPKVTSCGDGSALMKDPHLAEVVVRAAVESAGVPVTVKARLGWDSFTADEFARRMEAAGAAAICIHGRTREQYYGGKADWDAIGRVVRAVRIPVIASGDVFEPEDAVRILEQTGAAMCMIGRGSYGNPWIFGRAEAALRGDPVPPLPPFAERIELAREHMLLAVAERGEHRAVMESRHHVAWYCKGLHGAAALRAQVSRLSTVDEMNALLDEIIERGRDQP